jgi:hypothetical protein
MRSALEVGIESEKSELPLRANNDPLTNLKKYKTTVEDVSISK